MGFLHSSPASDQVIGDRDGGGGCACEVSYIREIKAKQPVAATVSDPTCSCSASASPLLRSTPRTGRIDGLQPAVAGEAVDSGDLI